MGLNLKKLGSDIRDIFDANTQADQQKRMAAGQPQYYQQQQAQMKPNPIVNGIRTTANVVASPFNPIKTALVDVNRDAFKLGSSLLTNNPTARDNALGSLGKDYSSIAQTGRDWVTRPAAQVVTTMGVKPTSYTPGSAAEKFVFGDRPVQNIQAGVQDTYRNHPNDPEWKRLAMAGGYGALQVANDLPVASTALKSVKPGVKAFEKSVQAPLTEAQLAQRNKAVVGWNEAMAKGNKAAAEIYDRQIKAIDNRPADQVGAVGRNIRATEKPNVVKSSNLESMAQNLTKAQAEQEARILKPRGTEKVRSVGRKVSEQLYNPYSEAERFNTITAKAMGISPKELLASRDLAHNLDAVGNSGTAAQNLAQKSGLQEVIGKYKPGSPEENNFITYMAMKRDLNVRANKGKQILPFDAKSMEKAVADFEARNPQAVTDLATVNSHFKTILDNARAAGTITEKDYRAALATEDFYAPVARVLGSEDVLRPTINANVRGSLSRQTALQTLSGSDKPINTTWDAVVGATTKTTKENAKNRAFNVLYQAADKNLADEMVRMGMNKEQSKSLLELKDAISQLQDLATKADKQVKLAARGAKVDSKKATAFNNRVQSQAVEKLAKSMEVTNPDGAAALRNLGRKDQAQLVDWLSNGMTEAQIARGNKLNAKAQESYATLMDMRAQAEGLLDQGKLARGEARDLNVLKNDATGRQVVRGFVDGYPVWLETTPDMAKMLQGLEPQQLDIVSRNLTGVQHVWRTFWTGIFNPAFSLKSKLFYDPAMMALNHSGARNQLRPSAWGGALGDNFADPGQFFDKLKQYGVAPVTGSRMMGDVKQSAEIMASHADFQSRVGYLAKHPSEALQALDLIGGKLAHSSRMQVARAEYAKSIDNNLSEADALANAARAYNNVLPNYARTSKLLRTIDAWIPYSNAGIAGTRAMTTAMRTDPVGWATKAGVFTTALAAVGVYSMTDETTKEFYQDMYDSNKQSVIQNNLVFALPGAKKDPETGEWTGIVKIPIPPEFRAPNAIVQDAVFKAKGGEANGYSPTVGAVSTIATGGVASIGRSGGINTELNPGLAATTELTSNKQNLGFGDSYAYGDAQYLPRNEQINKDTSQLAISAAQAFNKLPVGDISPAALDAQLKTLGSGGKIIRSVGSGLTKNENTTPDQLPGTDWKKSIVGTVSADGTKGMTEAKWHFRNQDEVRNSLATKTMRDQFDMLNTKADSPGDAQAKSQLLYESLQGDGTLWNAQKKQNDMDAKKSGISNPIFDLTPEQARAVTLYRGNSRLNAAKQTYAKDGSSLFQSLGLDEAWYQDFKNKEAEFYKKIEDKNKSKDPNVASIATAAKTYSGKAPEKPSVVIQSKLDAYYKLPKGTGERSAFLKANPDVIAYWDAQNGLTNEERLAMGLDLLGDGGTSKSGFGSSTPTLSKKGFNPYNYAVSTSAGGGKLKTIKAKGAAKVGIAAKQTASAKPKVTIKKSLV